MNATTNPLTNTKAGSAAFRPSARVSLGTIQANYAALAAYAPKAETAVAVKANCYGHGVARVAPALFEAGCKTFFTAYTSEGVSLRQVLGESPRIFVLHGIQPEEVGIFHEVRLTPICNTKAELETVLANGLDFALHFNTGINRLGLRLDDLDEIKARTEDNQPQLVMSHLACADQPDHPQNAYQLGNFQKVASAFPGVPASLAATAGIYLGADYHFDMVRPGIGLYGGGPARPAEVRLKTAMTLTAPILSVFNVKEGESVGYGATFTAKSDMTLATIALGYADGYLRSGGNYGFGVLNGEPCPLLGRVSMDLITVDVTDCSSTPEIGDRIELIGPQAGYEIQAEALGTISYELTSRLGDRIWRSWDD